jgi:hypothetical protein
VALGIGVNLATHPVVWWSLWPWRDRPAYPLWVLLAEAAVCAAEWLLLRWRLRRDATLLAVVVVGVNAASVAAGAVLVAARLMS